MSSAMPDAPASVALVGCAPALRLCDDVAAGPTAPLRVAITGPGGSGKTALLDAIAVRYRQADVPVVRGVGLSDVPPSGAVLVDDAHLLAAADLERMRGVVASPTARLIVACRPWPCSPQLSTVVNLLGRDRPPVALGHLDRAAVAARASAILGHQAPDMLADLVLAHTGGLPVLVDRMVTVLADTGEIDRVTAAMVPMPNSVVEQFRADLGQLDQRVRDALLVLALDAELDIDALAELLGVDVTAAADIVDGTIATGWLTDDGVLVAMARQAILRLTPGVRIKSVLQRLAGVHLSRRGSLLAVGCRLLDTGASGAGVAAVLEAAADEAMTESSALATRLFAAAADAGAPTIRLAARRAEATALAGDLDAALRLADHVVAEPQAPDLARGALVAAAVLAHRGQLSRSVEVYRWLHTAAPGGRTPVAVPALIGTGDLDEARSMLAGVGTGQPPTLREGAETLMAQGIHEAVSGSSTVALSQLTRAAAMLEPSGRTALLPDTPAALAAVVALHCGELEIADSVLSRAVATELGGTPAIVRHQLLRAWTAMQRGHLTFARTLLDEATRGDRLEPRDELVAAALEVGIARRDGELTAQSGIWARAREAVLRHPVDLYTLQPLGELSVAAARLPERPWLTPCLEHAQWLLDRLGRPVLWTTSMHWYGVQAAIAAESPPDARSHAAALTAASEESPYAATLAAASHCWLTMLGGEIDAALTVSVARRLDAVGLGWDGARLAAQAAIRTTDRAAMAMLLGCARSVHAAPPPSPQPSAAQPEWPEPGDGVLSQREVEVARLVLAGFTYKQAGERLFITAKTVEHHVARMRGRLGCASRGELLDRLRCLLAEQDGP
jgi:DNA-binding CsgD family transcriptional regulator